MTEREHALHDLERSLAKVDFWHAIQMAVLVGVGVLLLGFLI